MIDFKGKNIPVVEFFLTYQGECINIGSRVMLLRFKHCNESCPFCDTKDRLKTEAEYMISLEDIQKEIEKNNSGLLITGGEPTLDSKDSNYLDKTSDILNTIGCKNITVESNGFRLIELISSVNPIKEVDYVFSPKIFNGNDLDACIQKTWTLSRYKNVYFNIVCNDNESSDYYKMIMVYLNFLSKYKYFKRRVFLTPMGATKEEVIRNSKSTLELCSRFGFNLTTRLHILYDFR